MDEEMRARFDALDGMVEKVDATAAGLSLKIERLSEVLQATFDRIDAELSAIGKRLDGQDLQLAAIVTRLDEQDASHDRLMGKVDRLGVLARAGEEAVTSLDALAKRVARLEAARRGDNG